MDEPADGRTNLPTLPSTQPRVSIPEEKVQLLGHQLGRQIQPGDSNACIRTSLSFVWVAVNERLKEHMPAERLATLVEFQKNIREEGEDAFIELLKDMAKKGTWRDLFQNGMSSLRTLPHLKQLITFCPQRYFTNRALPRQCGTCHRPQRTVCYVLIVVVRDVDYSRSQLL